MSSKKRAPLTREELVDLAGRFDTWAAAARHLGMPATTVRERAARLNVQLEDHVSDAAKSVVSAAPSEWGDICALLKERGLDPNEWIVKRARVNEWGSEDGSANAQLRVDLEPVTSIIVPARTDGWKAPKPKKIKKSGRPELVAFLSDQHVPFHSRELHARLCEWLREEQPDRVVLLGDLLDLDQLSRWQPEPSWTAGVQETIDEAYGVLRDYRVAAPNARFQALAGNHEDRLRNSIIKNVGPLYGIRQADGGPSVLSTPFLLRMDELEIEWEPNDGSYDCARIRISDELQAIHGWIARKGSGASALQTLDHMRVSTIQGHTHRQSVVYRTTFDIDGAAKTLVAAETGTLAEIRGGLGHSNRPDWQMGFCTASVITDGDQAGRFSLDLAVYVPGSDDALLWRGRRY